jgi:hypothetical protein
MSVQTIANATWTRVLGTGLEVWQNTGANVNVEVLDRAVLIPKSRLGHWLVRKAAER